MSAKIDLLIKNLLSFFSLDASMPINRQKDRQFILKWQQKYTFDKAIKMSIRIDMTWVTVFESE